MSKTKSDDRLVDFLRSAITDGRAGLSDVPALVKRVVGENLWRERYVHQSKETISFKDFREFVEAAPPEGLGTTLKILQRLCADDARAVDLIEQTRAARKRGGDRRSEKFKSFKRDNVTFEKPPRGNAVSYSLRRLRENRADLHQKVLLGELSVNRAMIAAGFRRKSISITKDIEKTARAIREYFNPEEIGRLIEYLSKPKEG